jgi:hypothetical protein
MSKRRSPKRPYGGKAGGGKVGKSKRSGGHTRKSGTSKGGTHAKRRSAFGETLYPGVDYGTATREGCSSGKWGWSERAGAKTLAKALRQTGESAVRVYPCDECGRYHVGHLPFETRRGHRSADDYYGRA